jgi:large subunit ribosomal protein L21
MYGVVEIKGHQYRVQAGDIIDVQKMDAEVGSTVELDSVLFVGGDSPKVGTPVVDGAKVVAEVVRQARSRKVIVLKRKPGKYQTKNGHRQHYTALKIKEIKA